MFLRWRLQRINDKIDLQNVIVQQYQWRVEICEHYHSMNGDELVEAKIKLKRLTIKRERLIK